MKHQLFQEIWKSPATGKFYTVNFLSDEPMGSGVPDKLYLDGVDNMTYSHFRIVLKRTGEKYEIESFPDKFDDITLFIQKVSEIKELGNE